MAQWSEDEVEQLKNLFYDATVDEIEETFPNRNYASIRRKAYRLGLERHPNIQRINSIKNVDKIKLSNVDDDFANFICGFVAGEGTFTHAHRPTGTVRFSFKIQLANDDKQIIYDIKDAFGCGNVQTYGPRRENEKGSIHYTINGFGEIVNKVIPFFDKYGLYSSRKQRQYDEWREHIMSEIPENRKI
jgi:hypothetical protein